MHHLTPITSPTTFNAHYSSLPISQNMTHPMWTSTMLDVDVLVVMDVDVHVECEIPLFPLAISTECHDCKSWCCYSIGRLTYCCSLHHCSMRQWLSGSEGEHKTQHNNFFHEKRNFNMSKITCKYTSWRNKWLQNIERSLWKRFTAFNECNFNVPIANQKEND